MYVTDTRRAVGRKKVIFKTVKILKKGFGKGLDEQKVKQAKGEKVIHQEKCRWMRKEHQSKQSTEREQVKDNYRWHLVLDTMQELLQYVEGVLSGLRTSCYMLVTS